MGLACGDAGGLGYLHELPQAMRPNNGEPGFLNATNVC